MFAGINEGGSKASALKSFTSLTPLWESFPQSIQQCSSPPKTWHISWQSRGAVARSQFLSSQFSMPASRSGSWRYIYFCHLSPPHSDGFAFRTLWQVEDIKTTFDQISSVSVFPKVMWQLGVSIPPSLANFLERIEGGDTSTSNYLGPQLEALPQLTGIVRASRSMKLFRPSSIFTDYENTFKTTEEPDYLVDLLDNAAVGVLQSKE
jgi:hypothetical protein